MCGEMSERHGGPRRSWAAWLAARPVCRASRAATAVARRSRPANPPEYAVAMGRGGAAVSGSGCALARKIAELALEGFDVLLVDLDRVLVGLEPLQHPRVVLLVAGADAFLLGELLARIGEHR